ncbi:hypothetical protein DFA_05613 [Cavenderia fasciculata]|uniref:Uncharacterized protein n=1 Tax=Cavenderia fasciculata TaxID=261658 RepID=F4PLQ8_CACFS|nr:uncharacterized protein DFA_05613 [Cavenderia fasciculata]EGG23480.1 hypothetical protein DFA_05613 [Cavenderia fasciculata]|eukprot:XP_004361331.1 hypothetical protein DFA_05613 [Cavenderia fasciculata]
MSKVSSPSILVDILTPSLSFPSNLSPDEVISGTCASLGIPVEQLEFLTIGDSHLCCLIKNSKFSLDFIEALYQENTLLQYKLDKSNEAVETLQETFVQTSQQLQEKQSVIHQQIQSITMLQQIERQLTEESNQWKNKYEEELYKRKKNEKRIERMRMPKTNGATTTTTTGAASSASGAAGKSMPFSSPATSASVVSSSSSASSTPTVSTNNNNNNITSPSTTTTTLTNSTITIPTLAIPTTTTTTTTASAPVPVPVPASVSNSNMNVSATTNNATTNSTPQRPTSPNQFISPYLEREIERSKIRDLEYQKERQQIVDKNHHQQHQQQHHKINSTFFPISPPSSSSSTSNSASTAGPTKISQSHSNNNLSGILAGAATSTSLPNTTNNNNNSTSTTHTRITNTPSYEDVRKRQSSSSQHVYTQPLITPLSSPSRLNVPKKNNNNNISSPSPSTNNNNNNSNNTPSKILRSDDESLDVGVMSPM